MMFSYKKVHTYACYFYNRGLERAKVHDFSGAIEMLNRSIELDKKYIDARNLLGLCLFEVGEVGEALMQWIISKNTAGNNPVADRFLTIFHSSPAKLSHYIASVNKYNTALQLVRTGADDLALIQLKRALSKNPSYVKAWQLMALIYMRHEDFERAKKALRRSLKTDVANPVSVKYLKEIKNIKFDSRSMELGEIDLVKEDMDVKKVLEGHTTQSVTPKYNYQASKPDYRVFITLVAGMLFGIITVYALIVPGVKQSLKQERVSIENRYGEEVAEYLTKLDSLEKENLSLQSKLEALENDKDSYEDQYNKLENMQTNNNVLAAYNYFISIRRTSGGASEVQKFLLKEKLDVVTEEELENENCKALFEDILNTYPGILRMTISAGALYDEGRRYFESGNYPDAVKYFLMSYTEASDNEDCLYMLGRSYHLNQDPKKAKQYYQEYVARYPAGRHFEEVDGWLAEVGA